MTVIVHSNISHRCRTQTPTYALTAQIHQLRKVSNPLRHRLAHVRSHRNYRHRPLALTRCIQQRRHTLHQADNQLRLGRIQLACMLAGRVRRIDGGQRKARLQGAQHHNGVLGHIGHGDGQHIAALQAVLGAQALRHGRTVIAQSGVRVLAAGDAAHDGNLVRPLGNVLPHVLVQRHVGHGDLAVVRAPVVAVVGAVQSEVGERIAQGGWRGALQLMMCIGRCGRRRRGKERSLDSGLGLPMEGYAGRL